MIRVRQVKVEVISGNLISSLVEKLHINESDIIDYEIIKESIDARDKNKIFYVYELDVNLKNEDKIKLSNDVLKSEKREYKFIHSGTEKLDNRIVIVGSGPCGLFASYILCENGYKPLVIERGQCIENRVKTVEEFWENNKLNEESNVQFGEGGAGTFSDGKLNTMVKEEKNRQYKVFKTFIECGAPKEIMYSSHPHIGTDVLRTVIKNMREKIISMGGEFRYETKLTDIVIKDNKIESIIVNNNEEIKTNNVILAIGHSARDTFKMLYDKKIDMQAKPFAVGLRVIHSQNLINESQYGVKYTSVLPNASYKLTNNINDRGIYSFCMCPGGYVVNASSESSKLAINGMSNNLRDSGFANSAIIVSVKPSDFGTNPLDGIEFQRNLEKKAYEIGKGLIPIQLLKDYYSNKESISFGSIKPIFKGGYAFSNLNMLFPNYINDSLKESFKVFGRKIKGFDNGDTVLAGIESRTSSPVRINRDDNMQSNIKGIYPCGEGAGYAGGITSAAIDGIKVAEVIGTIYE